MRLAGFPVKRAAWEPWNWRQRGEAWNLDDGDEQATDWQIATNGVSCIACHDYVASPCNRTKDILSLLEWMRYARLNQLDWWENNDEA